MTSPLPRFRLPRFVLPLSLAALAACSSGSTAPTPTIDCDAVAPTSLAVGAQAIIDPTLHQGCLRLPGAGALGAEHLIVALSAAGQETPSGVQGSFMLQVTTDTFVAAALRRPAVALAPPTSVSSAFDLMLRERERGFAREPRMKRVGPGKAELRVPPVVGDQRSFKVCQTVSCTTFVSVGATAKFVGAHGAIFLDDTVPAGGYSQTDIDSIGALFEQ